MIQGSCLTLRPSDCSSSESEQDVEEGHVNSQREEIISWLTPMDFTACQTYYSRIKHPGTCQLFLDSNHYQSWVKRPGLALVCQGEPGAGKTVLASTVVEDLEARFGGNKDVGVAYFYLDYQRRGEQNKPEELLLSLLKQLLQRRSTLPHGIGDAYWHRRAFWNRPSWLDILKLLRWAVGEFARVFVVVDALDEGLANCRTAFLRELQKLQVQFAASIFTTSRHAVSGTCRFRDSVQLRIRAPDEDLQRYIADNMPRLSSFTHASDEIQTAIVSGVVSSAKGRYVINTSLDLVETTGY